MGLFPARVQKMVVTFSAIDPLSQECADGAAGELLLVDVVIELGNRDEIRGRLTRRQSLGADQFGDDLVPGPVGCQLLGQPRSETISPECQKRSLVGADQDSLETVREVGGKAVVGQNPLGPSLEFPVPGVCLELPEFLERGDCAMQGERESAENRELAGWSSWRDLFPVPVCLEPGVGFCDGRVGLEASRQAGRGGHVTARAIRSGLDQSQ